MDFLSRRTSRRFEDLKIEKTKIEEILITATFSPSGRGLKPCDFIAIENPETILKLAHSKKSGSKFAEKAALIIVITCRDVPTYIEDSSTAATIIQLKAHDLGISSCWLQTRGKENINGESTEKIIKDILNIPDGLHVANMIALGYSSEVLPRYLEDDANRALIHYEKW